MTTLHSFSDFHAHMTLEVFIVTLDYNQSGEKDLGNSYKIELEYIAMDI